MKSFFALGLLLTLAAQAEVRPLPVFNREFKLPATTKNFQIYTLTQGKTDVAVDEKAIPNCTINPEDTHDCVERRYVQEKTLRLKIAFDDSGYNYEDPAVTDLETNFRLSEFSQEELANLPKINWFGKGRKKNAEYAKTLVGFTVRTETVPEYVIDYEKSVFCDREYNWNPNCKDQLVYKIENRKYNFVRVSRLVK